MHECSELCNCIGKFSFLPLESGPLVVSSWLVSPEKTTAWYIVYAEQEVLFTKPWNASDTTLLLVSEDFKPLPKYEIYLFIFSQYKLNDILLQWVRFMSSCIFLCSVLGSNIIFYIISSRAKLAALRRASEKLFDLQCDILHNCLLKYMIILILLCSDKQPI